MTNEQRDEITVKAVCDSILDVIEGLDSDEKLEMLRMIANAVQALIVETEERES